VEACLLYPVGRGCYYNVLYREDPLQGPTPDLMIYVYYFSEEQEEEEEEDLYFDTTHYLRTRNQP